MSTGPATRAIAVNQANFRDIVIEGSRKLPVVVDFWAPWCAPCRALAPVLEQLAAEYSGRFTLVKVNTDENPGLAGEYGVRGIPNVKAFVNGELVDEFSGALPQPLVRRFIERLVPSPAEELRRQAAALYRERADAEGALALLARAVELDPGNEVARLDQAEIYLDSGRLAQARAALDSLSGRMQLEKRAATLAARLALAEGAARAADETELERRIAADAGDLEARLELAYRRAADGRYRDALDQLLEIVRRDRKFRDDAGRRTMLQLFAALGPDHPLVPEYRRRLAGAMY
ncbi:MAG TPA: co-chaperone YbbN [Burkholderiales bacterium]|nr:co-chaperone YbbN [Burkholderiales bacterium]